jgi:hypothetical protein
MSKDPFTLAHETFERFVREHPAVRRVMGAQVKDIEAFTTTRSTKLVDTATEHDFPFIRLLPIGGPSNVNLASNVVSFDFGLRAQINTGDQRVTFKLLPLVFAIYAACTAAIDASGELRSLEWGEMGGIITNLSLTNIETGLSNPQENQGITGWSSVVDITLHMVLPREAVKAWTGG